MPLRDLPEAQPDARPTWHVERVAELPALERAERLGSESVTDDATATLWRTGLDYRLVYDDTGEFSISFDGTRIRWAPVPGADEEAVRIDLLGRVFALALQLGGALPLHGSGVELPAGAIVFMAPKYHGKSTTALALVDAGAKLVADDMIAVVPGGPARVLPGVASARLWLNSAERLEVVNAGRIRDQGEAKVVLEALPESMVMQRPRRLLACYLLAPEPDTTAAVERERLTPVSAALSLVGQAKIGGLLSGRESARLLSLATRVAAAAPVYRLSVPRTLDRLPELVDRLMAWHTAEVAVGAAG